MQLAYRDLLKARPALETQLAQFPLRVFSGRENPTAGVKAVFFCYALPARNLASGEWDEQADYTKWYLYDVASGDILEEAEGIDAVIRSEPDTSRRRALDDATLRDIRQTVEKHITNSYLKASQAPSASSRCSGRGWNWVK